MLLVRIRSGAFWEGTFTRTSFWATKKEPHNEGSGSMRYAPAIALALAIIALVALVFPLVQTQRHLREEHAELGRTNGELVQARAASDELERVVSNLKAELDSANKARKELKENLDEANSDVDQLHKDVELAQSQLQDRESQVQELTADLAKARTDLESAANEAKTSQAALDQANAEIERLKAELDQKALPPVSVSPPEESPQ